ncbi:MAG: S41 family peptidase [Bdellovibrionaceae bacterium]|nr:S41 family peptidase [Pseudobdellovibrionaceae bacterium]
MIRKLGIFSFIILSSSWLAWKTFAADDRYLNLQIFAKVLNIVQQYYVEPVDSQKLIYGGIKGMLRELDPHTNFLPPDIYKEFESETSGEFGGIGIEISVEDGILTIISPIEDTPAWKAGIQPGDKIVEINGESTKGLSLVEAAQKMKGKNGEKIKLGIMREGLEEPKTYTLAREIVKLHSVKFVDLEDGYGYIRLTSFIENSAKEMREQLANLKKKQKNIKGIILDLRRNPGGLLDQAVQVSNLFLERGVIVSTIGRDKNKKEVIQAKDSGTYSGFPVIVLINESSASASEIVAGALKDNKRALIMGKRSFGKGSVQSVVKMGDGSGLKLTVARYYTPSGISIQAEGIKPDIEVDEMDMATIEKAKENYHVRREADIEGHLVNESEKAKQKKKEMAKSSWWQKFNAKEKNDKNSLLTNDYQVLQAYNYIKAWKVFKSL